MNGRDPNSFGRIWSRQVPLHGISQRSRSSQSQGRARLARLDKLQPVVGRDMFPFRVFNQPILYQNAPTWTDTYGAANYRTFSVWTGNAPNYVLDDTGLLNGSLILFPETVQVARTCGYNFNEPVANESYNEAYSNQAVGLYGQDFSPTSSEIMFTAPPNSYAAFWITWDANVIVDGNNQVIWPTLHFGGITYGASTPGYFGDANPVNFIVNSFGQVGDIPFIPDLSFLEMATFCPTSFPAILVAVIQIGAQGSGGDTGNDGTAYIIQCQHNHITQALTPSYRGDYNKMAIYFPGDTIHVTDNDGVDAIAVNSSRYAVQQYSPLDFGWPNYDTNANIYSGGESFWSTVGTPYFDSSTFVPTSDFSVTATPSDILLAPLADAVQLSVSLDVSANASNGYTVQWYIKYPGSSALSWEAIVDGTDYAGTGTITGNSATYSALGSHTSTLNITNTTGMGGFMFYAQITEGQVTPGAPYPQPYYTLPVVLTTSPCFVVSPQDYNTAPGGSAMFWVVTTGGATATYQWQRNGVNVTDGTTYQGATTPQLAILNVTGLSNGDQFVCVVTTDGGTVPSPPATLGIT